MATKESRPSGTLAGVMYARTNTSPTYTRFIHRDTVMIAEGWKDIMSLSRVRQVTRRRSNLKNVWTLADLFRPQRSNPKNVWTMAVLIK